MRLRHLQQLVIMLQLQLGLSLDVVNPLAPEAGCSIG